MSYPYSSYGNQPQYPVRNAYPQRHDNGHQQAPPPHFQHQYQHNVSPQQAHGYQPPPPVAPPVDPFRAYYADRLRELTFNSRPIIQDLSVLAMQQRDTGHWGNMAAVVEEIEKAVYRSPPPEKLPKLYLLDSISKNVGPPYTLHLLPPLVPRLYIRTYREVDGVTRNKMAEMVSLWRRSGPDGGELYGAGVREEVERELFGRTPLTGITGGAGGAGGVSIPPPTLPIISGGGSTGTGTATPPPSQPLPQTSGPTKSQVLEAINKTIQAKHAEAAQKPWQANVKQQLGALMGLSEMVMTRDVPVGDLKQIMDQLAGMGYVTGNAQEAAGRGGQAGQVGQGGLQAPTPDHAQYQGGGAGGERSPMPGLPPFAGTMPTPTPTLTTPTLQAQQQQPGGTPVGAGGQSGRVGGGADISSILMGLSSSGILGMGSRTPDVPQMQVQVQAQQPSKGHEKAQRMREYEDMVLGLDVQLGSLDLNRFTIIPLDHLPIKCAQCSHRFATSSDELDAHMDWHVRRNRSERQSAGRGAHRRWLPRADEWEKEIPTAGSAGDGESSAMGVAADDSATTGPGHGAGAGAGVAGEGKPQRSVEELKRKFVKVPPGKNGQGGGGEGDVKCPICKEAFRAEWSEDEEEWVWRNAISVNGKVYHATCRAESLASRARAKSAGLRNSTGGTKSPTKSASPGRTPEPVSAVGVKVEPHPLSRSVHASEDQGTTADVDMDKNDMAVDAVQGVADVGGDGDGDGAVGTGKRKASEEVVVDEPKRARTSLEPQSQAQSQLDVNPADQSGDSGASVQAADAVPAQGGIEAQAVLDANAEIATNTNVEAISTEPQAGQPVVQAGLNVFAAAPVAENRSVTPTFNPDLLRDTLAGLKGFQMPVQIPAADQVQQPQPQGQDAAQNKEGGGVAGTGGFSGIPGFSL